MNSIYSIDYKGKTPIPCQVIDYDKNKPKIIGGDKLNGLTTYIVRL